MYKRQGFWNTGETYSHNQSLRVNYEIPFKLFPLIDFISSNYSYNGDFSWERGSDAMAQVEDELGNVLGRVNTIQNANTQSLNTSLNLSRFYRNIGLIQKRKLNNTVQRIKNILIGFATGISRFRVNYSENNGQVLPGYTQSLGFLGTTKPSLGFVFGSQSDIRFEAAKNGWLTEFPSFNEQYTKVHNNKFDLVAEISWFDDFSIDINANKSYSENFFENFSVTNNEYNSLNPYKSGNFSISTIMLKTSFEKSDQNNSETFGDFQKNRLIIAKRLALLNGNSNGQVDESGFPQGYGKNNQAVLIPSFIAAYSGSDPNKISLNAIKNTPVSYTHLTLPTTPYV